MIVETLGLAGHADEAFRLGTALLARPADADDDAGGTWRRDVHLAVARAAVAGTDWPLATAHLWGARAADDGSDPALAARLEALMRWSRWVRSAATTPSASRWRRSRPLSGSPTPTRCARPSWCTAGARAPVTSTPPRAPSPEL